MSPTALSLRLLRQSGYSADVVERFIAAVQRKRDLFGFIDLVAIRRGEAGVLGIQATSTAHVGDRLKKARGKAELRTWLAAGNQFEVWGWSLQGERWTCKRVAVNAGDLQAVEVEPQRPRRARKGERQGDLFA